MFVSVSRIFRFYVPNGYFCFLFLLSLTLRSFALIHKRVCSPFWRINRVIYFSWGPRRPFEIRRHRPAAAGSGSRSAGRAVPEADVDMIHRDFHRRNISYRPRDITVLRYIILTSYPFRGRNTFLYIRDPIEALRASKKFGILQLHRHWPRNRISCVHFVSKKKLPRRPSSSQRAPNESYGNSQPFPLRCGIFCKN